MQGAARQALGLVAVSALLYFTALGGAELWDEDEPLFAGTAREMLARREWIVPYFNGHILPDKPVLSYWVMMLGYKLFGPTEFAARAGSALFSIGTVLLTWLLGRRLFSARAGAWAGFALATSISFDIVARAATPDAVLTFFCTLAMVCFVESLGSCGQDAVARKPRGLRYDGGLRTLALTGTYAAMGMAALAKGPIGLLLPAATIGFFLLCAALPAGNLPAESQAGWRAATKAAWLGFVRRGHPRHFCAVLHSIRPLMGLAVVLAIAGPWYLAVGLNTDGAWLTGFLGKHNLGRFLNPMEHHRGPFFYYLISVMIGFFPWSLLLG
ncbi:MAG: ArnT family glycosyltransferase, partial [Pirellulales bacterium]